MTRFRSTLALILTLITAFLVSCSNPSVTPKAVSYTPAQVAQIQTYKSDISALRDRLPELATLIQNREWSDVRSFIHGPLGELRRKTSNLARTLAPSVQKPALEAAQNIFGHLEEIDEAAENSDYRQAIRNYAEAIKDFDAFFQFVPNA